MNDSRTIEWRVIAVAYAISFVAGIVIGGAWGILAFLVASLSSEVVVGVLSSPLGYILGFVVSLIPVVVGAVYLVRSVDHAESKHCIVFGGVSLALLFAMGLIVGELTFAWHDILYYVAVIPTALIAGRMAGG